MKFELVWCKKWKIRPGWEHAGICKYALKKLLIVTIRSKLDMNISVKNILTYFNWQMLQLHIACSTDLDL